MHDPDTLWSTLGADDRSTAYDNGNAVADSAALNKVRVDASAQYRAAHPGALDLPYQPGDRTAWDLYPAADPAAPCLVFIHGGYWWKNRRQDFACLAEGIAAHGWSVAIPGYDLAPDVSVTAIVAEIRTALDWLQANGPAHGIAGTTILSGWSAGGHLAAMTLDHPMVAAGIGISGVYELGPLRDTNLNQYLRLTDADLALSSPLRLPVIDKEFAIAYGSLELPALVHSSRKFHAHRAAQHAPGALLPVAHADHFTIITQMRDPDSRLIRAIRDLVPR
jgi:arylformamidase